MKLPPFVLALTVSPRFAVVPPPTVAVFEFPSPEESVRALGAKESVLVSAKLSADEGIITLERAESDKALSAQELGISGTVSAENAAKVGPLTGAKVLVTGRVIKLISDLSLCLVQAPHVPASGPKYRVTILAALGDRDPEMLEQLQGALTNQKISGIAWWRKNPHTGTRPAPEDMGVSRWFEDRVTKGVHGRARAPLPSRCRHWRQTPRAESPLPRAPGRGFASPADSRCGARRRDE